MFPSDAYFNSLCHTPVALKFIEASIQEVPQVAPNQGSRFVYTSLKFMLTLLRGGVVLEEVIAFQLKLVVRLLITDVFRCEFS